MNFQFTHPYWIALLPIAWAWVIWLAWKSDVQISPFRQWFALGLRLIVVLLAVMAIAGIQWLKPQEGVNVFFLLDRSDSMPSPQQEAARKYVNKLLAEKKKGDRGGILIFGSEPALETDCDENISENVSNNILAVVGADRTDIAAAIRLGTAGFPETGQKRLVLLSDGNENMGDALAALQTARRFDVSLDVVPLGQERANDVSVQKLGLPAYIKEKQTFEGKIFVNSASAGPATIRVYRNDQLMGEHNVNLTPGKNLFSFPQTLNDPGFYRYGVVVEAAGDRVPQNNKAAGFTTVEGEPRVLIVSSRPEEDQPLLQALQSSGLKVGLVGTPNFPQTLAEMQSYDAIFISNIPAGDIGTDVLKLLESAVRDFGVGLVCIGGDQAYAAGGYRNTPLESTLPVNMELDSKKVLPSGAVALIMHGMEFGNGNQIARDCTIGVLDALGPQDEMGVVLWDGHERWLFPMTKVGDKKELGGKIAGMNQGDLPSFQGVMQMAHEGLKKTTANLKHIIVFSDGDPGAPGKPLMDSIVNDKITVSTVLISGHAGPDTMRFIADAGKGRFYDIKNPWELPQIFLKETAVVLKSAIFEEPFKPVQVSSSEPLRGIAANEYPQLLGYVCTTPKPRAETPLVTEKGDPLLAHWQYGLGRAVAFTSDAKSRWSKQWLGWSGYAKFWQQTANWSLRRLDPSSLSPEVTVEQGEGHISVEALDADGNYRNFLNLQAIVVDPKGNRQTVRLEQKGPGHYEVNFPTKEVGSYMLNLMEMKDGKLAGYQPVGASVNYSPEFNDSEPNINLLKRLADTGHGQFLNFAQPSVSNPFLHDRQKTFQPRDLWESLLKLAIILFTLDVGFRRIQIEREELQKAWAWVQGTVVFWRARRRPAESDQSLSALLARRDQVRQEQTAPIIEPKADLFQPQKTVNVSTPTPSEVAQSAPAEPEAKQERPEEPANTTSRLLEAKRRAKKKME